MDLKNWEAGDKVNASDLNNNFLIALTLTFGNGSDGDVVISTNTELSSDMYYNDLTINDGITLNPKGYKIYVLGTLSCLGTGKIASNGNNGSNRIGGIAAYTSGTLPRPLAGSNGGAGGNVGYPEAGDNGVSQEKCFSGSGSSGGDGGDSDQTNGADGGNGGSTTNAIKNNKENLFLLNTFVDIDGVGLNVAGSSGGGGGGGDGHADGGYGGGAGSSGGIVLIFAKNIIILNSEAKGGDGSNGEDGYRSYENDAGGGGGGGGGGRGGAILIFYQTKTTVNTDVSGGSGGFGGAGGAVTHPGPLAVAGDDGEDGEDGGTGFVQEISLG